MNKFKREEILAVFNSIESVEEHFSVDEAWILVENNKELHEKLNTVGVSSDIINKYESEDNLTCLLSIAFGEGYATGYDGYNFYWKEENKMGELVSNVEEWSKNKGLDKADPTKQFLKVSEEFGEIAAALARNDEDEFQDAVGDTVVTLIILAQQKGYTLEECLQKAYDVIKDRTGKMIDGVFVKSEDLKR